jgi:hypothetical protein
VVRGSDRDQFGSSGFEIAAERRFLPPTTSRSGFAFRLSVSAACDALVQLQVAARAAKKLKLGRRAVTLASDSAAIPEAGVYAATRRKVTFTG